MVTKQQQFQGADGSSATIALSRLRNANAARQVRDRLQRRRRRFRRNARSDPKRRLDRQHRPKDVNGYESTAVSRFVFHLSFILWINSVLFYFSWQQQLKRHPLWKIMFKKKWCKRIFILLNHYRANARWQKGGATAQRNDYELAKSRTGT